MEHINLKQLASDLLEKIDSKPMSASEILNTYTKKHRHISGNTRRALSSLIFNAIRSKARLNYAYPDKNWEQKLDLLETNGIPDISGAPDWIQWETPEWLIKHIPNPEFELPAMLEPAPVVLRATTDRTLVADMLKNEGIETIPTSRSPFGLILKERCVVTDSKAYKKGLVEIQDEGAQLVSIEIGVNPHESVFDFCAGAGGKSLIFAQLMKNKGFIQAYDASFKRLSELNGRARRAGISIIKPVYKLPEAHKKFDHVVVDAPCSGVGTIRRTPDIRWKLSEKQLKNIVSKQAEILSLAQEYVKNGHYLSYITCSLTYDENEGQIDSFIRRFPRFCIQKQMRFSPARTQTDGFFLCVLQKR